MPKVTQQIDIRDRLWASSQTLALNHYTICIEDNLAPMTGKSLIAKIHDGYLLGILRGKTNIVLNIHRL